MDDKTKGALMVIGCLTVPILIVVSAIWSGLVLSVIWGWFMVPILGLPNIGVVEAIAISLVVSWLTKARVPTEKGRDKWETFIEAILLAIFNPLFVLVMAYILTFFMK